MARWAPAKQDVMAALADDILHNYGHGRVIVAVDGLDERATAGFADELAEALRRRHTVFRASIRDFHRPRAERSRERLGTPEEFYRESFDYSVLSRVLIDPFRMGGSTGFVTADFDVDRDAKIQPKWLTGPADAVLVIDGPFLNRPELRGQWNYSLWLSGAAEPVPGAELYLASADPAAAASALIDDTDPEHPRRVFADSC